MGQTRQQCGSKLQRTLVVFMLLCAYKKISCAVIDYAVQPHPPEFLEEPQSQTLLEGGSVTLRCRFNVTLLGSNYPCPHLIWRKDGNDIVNISQICVKKEVESKYVIKTAASELRYPSVQIQHGGYYECLAVDGKRKFSKEGMGRFVTSSRRAYLRVIAPDSSVGSGEESSGEDEIVLLIGEPFVLPCQSDPVYRAEWFQNGTQIIPGYRGIEILSNNSLLLLSPSAENSGNYQCTSWFSGQQVNTTHFTIKVIHDFYSGSPQLFLDTSSSMMTNGNSVNMTCLVGGVTTNTSATVQLLKNSVRIESIATNISDYEKQTFFVTSGGKYACELWLQGDVYTSPIITIVEIQQPTVSSKDKALFNSELPLTCDGKDDSFSSIYWYKNGKTVNFANQAQLRTVDFANQGQTMKDNSFEKLSGVYQCFEEGPGGTSTTTYRVFDSIFSNPPTNLMCTVQFISATDFKPRVVMNWDLPDYIAAGEVSSYIVFSNDGLHFSQDMMETSAIIDLNGIDDSETTEGDFEIFVSTNRGHNNGNHTSAPTRCQIWTIERALDPPLPLSVTCPDTVGGSIDFKWRNPLHQSNFNIHVEEIYISAKCIYGNSSINEKTIGYSTFIDYDITPQASYNVKFDNSDGAVCIAWGYYKFDATYKTPDYIVHIPPKACLTPPSDRGNSNVLLGLSCAQKQVELSWNTSLSIFIHIDNITLQAQCSYNVTMQEILSISPAAFSGSEVVHNISHDAACTFYGHYTDTRSGMKETIPAAQCYMDQFSDRMFYPPVVVPDQSVYYLLIPTSYSVLPTPTSKIPTPSSVSSSTLTSPITSKFSPTDKNLKVSSSTLTSPFSPTDKNLKDVWIILSVCVVFIMVVILVLLVLVFYCKLQSRYSVEQLKFLSDQEVDTNYYPFNAPMRDLDVFSIKTVTDTNEVLEITSNVVGFGIIADERSLASNSEEKEDGTLSMRDISSPSASSHDIKYFSAKKNASFKLESFKLKSVASSEDGKNHLLNKFLANNYNGEEGEAEVVISESENKCTVPPNDFSAHPFLQSAPEIVSPRLSPRLWGASNTGAGSSGYGTGDDYNCSGFSEVSNDYPSKRLQEVKARRPYDDVNQPPIQSLINSTKLIEEGLSSDSDIVLPSTHSPLPKPNKHCQGGVTPTAVLGEEVNQSLKTEMECHLSRGSGYYKEVEGYLHMVSNRTDPSSDVSV